MGRGLLSMDQHRRAFLKAAILACSGLPRVARAGDELRRPVVRLKLGWVANVQYAGEWIALDRGLFGKQHIDVDWTAGGPNTPDSAVMLAAGRTDIAYTSWLPFLDAIARGNDLVLIGVVLPQSPLGIFSLPKKPVRAARDLIDLRILAQGPNEKTSIDATLSIAGLPRQWTFVPVGSSPDPLLMGEGDAFVGFCTNQMIMLEMMGLKPDRDFLFTRFSDMGFVTYGALIATTRAYLAANRPLVIAFLRGLIQGWDQNEADPLVAPRLVVEKYGEDYGFDLDQQVRQNQIQIPFTHYRDPPSRPRLSLDRALMVGPMYAAAHAAGHENLPDIDQIADFSIVDEAHQGL